MKEKPDMTIKPDSLLLSGDRCFFSLQGEGDSLGKPAIFLRLHLCNLKCSFCDTPYTWNRNDERFWDEPKRWTTIETVNRIKQFRCKRLVITGGEPLLQREAIIEIMDMLGDDWVFEIETNGTLPPFGSERQIQYNVSPKLANSNNPEQARYHPGILREYNRLNSSFKFVVVSPEDLPEIEKIIQECELDNDKIIIMPEGITVEAVAEHGRAVAELCKKKGWRLVPRLQILLWGKERKK